ncbi:MAG: hypothetical protein ACJARZ_001556 [Dokdonia sp.]|jgi:hypothetical protein
MGLRGVFVFGFLVVVFFFAIKPWLNCVKNTNMKRDYGYIGMLDFIKKTRVKAQYEAFKNGKHPQNRRLGYAI